MLVRHKFVVVCQFTCFQAVCALASTETSEFLERVLVLAPTRYTAAASTIPRPEQPPTALHYNSCVSHKVSGRH